LERGRVAADLASHHPRQVAVKVMAELADICRGAREAEQRAEPCWLATVMRVRGSAYRQTGARLLFSSGEMLSGSVSGGCLEASIVRKGPWLTRERAVCVRYDGGREEDDEESPRGTGCDGTVDILLERVSLGAVGDPLLFIEQCLAREQRGVLVTVFESSNPGVPVAARLALGEAGDFSASIADEALCVALSWAAEGALRETHPRSRIVHGDGFQALLEIIEPTPHLFVFGSGPDALPVVELAAALGFGVTVCDSDPRVALRERFAPLAELHLGSMLALRSKLAARRRPLAVVMSHHYATDQQALALLLESPALYIGMLGPARRTQRMLEELYGAQRLGMPDTSRLRAPIGLDLGAETPPQIALAVLAEAQAVLSQASAEPLSRHVRPIHPAASDLTLPSLPLLARTGTR
jgi:xanthine dehydrogenase accessory factor